MGGDLDRAVEILTGASRGCVFTGAGISAESGIPTFRDPGGIWERFDPAEVGTPEGLRTTLERDPGRLRSFLAETVATLERAEPNPGHRAVADLERMGVVDAVVTQNVDGLHTQAGSRRVIEVHGSLYRFRCLVCRETRSIERSRVLALGRALADDGVRGVAQALALLPRCACGAPMRPDVVLFGEAVQSMDRAFAAAQGADVLVVAGTSGAVYPAAALPREAKRSGAAVIDVNPGESAYGGLADVRIEGKTGVVLPELARRVAERGRGSAGRG